MLGAISLLSIDYEHVMIGEAQHADQPFARDNSITVTFKDCETRPLQ